MRRKVGLALLMNLAICGHAPSVASVLQETAQNTIGAIDVGPGIVRNEPVPPATRRPRRRIEYRYCQSGLKPVARAIPVWNSRPAISVGTKSNRPAPARRSW